MENLKEILEQHSEWLKDPAQGKRANLRGANLVNADLRGANLASANLEGANLRSANLRGADLKSADLEGAYLASADLRDADLRDANLVGANLVGANLPAFSICPTEGAFIAFKKAEGVVLKLQILEGAARVSSLVGRKCRASAVRVLAAWIDGKWDSSPRPLRSTHDSQFVYCVGTDVSATLDSDIRVECTKGIHFFMTFEEARDY